MNLPRSASRNVDGFTLLEVMLFLAVSGSMMAIAFIGLGPRLRNLRFTESTRSIESRVTSEFSASAAGKSQGLEKYSCGVVSNGWGTNAVITKVENSNNQPGSSAGCVVNGKIAIFEADRVTFHSIYSLSRPVATCASPANFNTVSSCYRSRIARGYFSWGGTVTFDEPPYPESYKYPNGITASSSLNNDGKVLAFGYIQDPDSTQTYQFFHRDGENADWTMQLLDDNNTAVTEDSSKPDSVANPFVCFKLEKRTVKMSFTVNSIKPKMEYEPCV